MTLDRILNGIMAQSPTKRANLTVRDIDTITRQIQPIVDAEVQLKAEQVERKLKDGDYLNAVRIYASQQFWK